MSASKGRSSRPSSGSKRPPRPQPLHWDIPTDYAASRRILEDIIQRIRKHRYSERDRDAIHLALDEALMNALKHGNGMNRAKSVHVDALIGPRRARISIEDEGPGFDRSSVPDPTCDENICKPHGRGILLMESVMNQVKFDRGGRRVTLVKTAS